MLEGVKIKWNICFEVIYKNFLLCLVFFLFLDCGFINFYWILFFVDFGVELIYKGKYLNLKVKYEYINFFSIKKFKVEIF